MTGHASAHPSATSLLLQRVGQQVLELTASSLHGEEGTVGSDVSSSETQQEAWYHAEMQGGRRSVTRHGAVVSSTMMSRLPSAPRGGRRDGQGQSGGALEVVCRAIRMIRRLL